MQFIRQNLFLIILGAVFLMVAGGLVTYNFMVSDDVDTTLMAPRDTLRGQLSGFAGKSISPEQIKEMEDRATRLKTTAEDLLKKSTQWNNHAYGVLQLNAGGKQIPAFPIEKQYDQNGSLYLNFIVTYQREMNDLLASMHPVGPVDPTEAARRVQAEATRMTKEIERENAAKAKAAAESAGRASGTPVAAAAPSAIVEESLEPGVPMPAGAVVNSANVTPDLATQARMAAFNQMKLEQARQGAIYATPESLDFVFADKSAITAPYTKLWEAQLNLWVHRDIIHAIVETNKEVAGDNATVLNSAVKRLVKIDVNELYYVDKAGTAAAPTAGVGPTAPPPGEENFEEPEPMPMGPVPVMPGAHPGAAAAAGTTTVLNIPLTGRTTCQQYDVLHYSFKVVMPIQYIVALERNLMRQNYHTILKVDLATPIDSTNAVNLAVPPLYYGSSPVMEVTFQCELLLMTSWERGTFDSANSKWTLPPLIPVQVLKYQLQPLAADALRPEDLTRISTLPN